MQAIITRIDAEQAIREGRETARLNRRLEESEKRAAQLEKQNAELSVKLRMCRSVIARHNSVLALKYQGMREGRELERKEARGNVIDGIIIGMAAGAFMVLGLLAVMIR